LWFVLFTEMIADEANQASPEPGSPGKDSLGIQQVCTIFLLGAGDAPFSNDDSLR